MVFMAKSSHAVRGILGWMFAPIVLIIAQGDAAALGVEPERPGQDDFVKSAIYAASALWVLNDAGILFRLRRGDAGPTRIELPAPALGICSQSGEPVILTGGGDKAIPWSIWRLETGQWVKKVEIQRKGERPLDLSCHESRVTLLTTKRLMEVSATNVRAVRLKGSLTSDFAVTFHSFDDGAHLWLAVNAGEWGGGLQRIDLRSGHIRRIASDAFNAITTDSREPGCIIAAAGLIHMMTDGKLVKVCGDRVTSFYSAPLQTDLPANDVRSFNLMPFFGVDTRGERLTAIGLDSVYIFDGDAPPRKSPMPRFDQVGPFGVSYALPGYAILLTRISSRVSVSGPEPMLIPIDDK